MTYFVNFLLVLVYYFIIKIIVGGKDRSCKLFFVFVTLHAILFRALASPFNYVDTDLYADGFKEIADMSFVDAVFVPNIYSSWGVGFISLNWILNRFTPDVTLNFVVISIVSVYGVLLYYFKSSYSFLISVLFYLLYPMLYFMGFGVIRQHLSIVFILWALYFIDEIKKSIPLILIGISCHFSALIILPFYLIRKIDIKLLDIKRVIVISIIGVTFLKLLIMYGMSYLPEYYKNVSEGDGENNRLPFLIIGSLIFMFLYTRVLNKMNNPNDMNIVRFMLYGLLVSLFSIGFPGGGRLTLPFIYVMPVAIAQLYKYSGTKMKRVCGIYTFFLFVVVFVQLYLADYQYGYSLIWEK